MIAGVNNFQPYYLLQQSEWSQRPELAYDMYCVRIWYQEGM